MIHIGNKLPVLVAFLLLVGGVTLVLSQNPTLLAYLVDVCEYLEGANFVWYSIPISILDLCGSILSCNSYRQSLVANKRQVSWLESLVACTLAQFGGTTLTGAILGQTPSWILSHSAFPALLLAWWLTFCLPSDIFYYFISTNPVFLFIVGLGGSVSAGHAVTSWGMDKALFNAAHVNSKRISESVLTCILCGTLSACGGGLLHDWFSMSRSESFVSVISPAIFSIGDYTSSATLTRSFICAVTYYIVLNPTGYLPLGGFSLTKGEGHMLIIGLQIFNFLSKQVLPTTDVFQMISDLTLGILMINPVVNVIDEADSTPDDHDKKHN